MDREHSSIAVDSMGRGVLSFNVQVLNPAPTGTFNSTATVRQSSKIDIASIILSYPSPGINGAILAAGTLNIVVSCAFRLQC